ncbi:protein of unknown function [Rhodovastum atsumiense]|nr:protein of unknown function [Rhodovastum atsumiense]
MDQSPIVPFRNGQSATRRYPGEHAQFCETAGSDCHFPNAQGVYKTCLVCLPWLGNLLLSLIWTHLPSHFAEPCNLQAYLQQNDIFIFLQERIEKFQDAIRLHCLNAVFKGLVAYRITIYLI